MTRSIRMGIQSPDPGGWSFPPCPEPPPWSALDLSLRATPIPSPLPYPGEYPQPLEGSREPPRLKYDDTGSFLEGNRHGLDGGGGTSKLNSTASPPPLPASLPGPRAHLSHPPPRHELPCLGPFYLHPTSARQILFTAPHTLGAAEGHGALRERVPPPRGKLGEKLVGSFICPPPDPLPIRPWSSAADTTPLPSQK